MDKFDSQKYNKRDKMRLEKYMYKTSNNSPERKTNNNILNKNHQKIFSSGKTDNKKQYETFHTNEDDNSKYLDLLNSNSSFESNSESEKNDSII